jgi:DNA-binding LacI/PurR family transcriptional regulator
MKITIDEIAEMAGVSKTTVSRVLNNKPDVKPETREQIHSLIAKYDFKPNAMAKAFSIQKSHSIGLIIPHEATYIFSNPFYVEVMRGVSTEVDKLGYFLFLCYPHDQNYMDIYKQKRVDGFILMSPGSFHHNIITSLNSIQAPFVSTSFVPDEKEMVFVDVDNYKGGLMVMEHLIALGHTRIGFIGKPNLTSSIERFDGYKYSLQKHSIPFDPELVRVAENASINGGAQITGELLNISNPPTAIFLVNDMLAIGAVRVIQEKGLSVPGDISIVGFDDVPLAECVNPPLTTVRQPAFEKGVKAARMLIQILEKKKSPKSQILDVELVVRGTTGPVPEKR